MYDSQIPPKYIFTPKMLLRAVEEDEGNGIGKIGLWIDLTNTDRFYDKKEVEMEDVEYVKLNCKGYTPLLLLFATSKVLALLLQTRRGAVAASNRRVHSHCGKFPTATP